MNKKLQLHLLKNFQKHCIIAFAIVAFITQSNAQTVQREIIASSGSCMFSDGILVQQTIGQPYFTGGFYSNEFSIHPGFQQSNRIMNVELINSTFDLRLNLYPNPAASSVNIITDGIINDAYLQVIDISGKIIVNEKIAEMKNYQINCETWQNGLYIITISDAKNNKYSSKLIISK